MIQKIHTTLVVPYNIKKMYSLVKDVNSYSLFLPFCSKSHIIELKKNYMIASLEIIKFGMKNTFITKNILDTNKSIKIYLINGPFLMLKGKWTFTNLKKKCLINFCIEFELFNSFLKKITKNFLKDTTNLIVLSFAKRAKEIF